MKYAGGTLPPRPRPGQPGRYIPRPARPVYIPARPVYTPAWPARSVYTGPAGIYTGPVWSGYWYFILTGEFHLFYLECYIYFLDYGWSWQILMKIVQNMAKFNEHMSKYHKILWKHVKLWSNLMIIGQKQEGREGDRAYYLEELRKLKQMYGIKKHYLEVLLNVN